MSQEDYNNPVSDSMIIDDAPTTMLFGGSGGSSQKRSRGETNTSLIPVSSSQVAQCSYDSYEKKFKLGNRQIMTVELVGLVSEISQRPSDNTLVILFNDGTSSEPRPLSVTKGVDAMNITEEANRYKVGSFGRIVSARPSPFAASEERSIAAYHLEPLEDSNLLTWHLTRIITLSIEEQLGMTRSDEDKMNKGNVLPPQHPRYNASQQQQQPQQQQQLYVQPQQQLQHQSSKPSCRQVQQQAYPQQQQQQLSLQARMPIQQQQAYAGQVYQQVAATPQQQYQQEIPRPQQQLVPGQHHLQQQQQQQQQQQSKPRQHVYYGGATNTATAASISAQGHSHRAIAAGGGDQIMLWLESMRNTFANGFSIDDVHQQFPQATRGDIVFCETSPRIVGRANLHDN